MADFHLSVKTVSRSAGRSATAAAAYRAGAKITDQRTGEIHDYTRKGGVESAELVLPAGAAEWTADRAALWNAAEQAETRKNSTVAREFEIALPAELSPEERRRLAHDFAREIVERHGCAADVCIHEPSKGGDKRNHHAHILLSTRRLGPEGFAGKTRELDDQKTGPQIVTQWRERFASLQNERLCEAGIDARVDHRSLVAQGIDREPQQHLGPALSGMVRRGESAFVIEARQREAAERLERAAELGALERIGAKLDQSILDLTGQLERARAEACELAGQQGEAIGQTTRKRAKTEPARDQEQTPRPAPRPALVLSAISEQAEALAHKYAQDAAQRLRDSMKAKAQAQAAAAELARQRAAEEQKAKQEAERKAPSAQEWVRLMREARELENERIEKAKEPPETPARERDDGPSFGR